MDYKAYALMAILLASVASVALVGTANAQTTELTVETDAESYETGDTIIVTIQLTATNINQPILIQVLDPQGNRDRIDQLDVAATNGSATYPIATGAGGVMNTDGTYTVIVNYKTTSEETTFEFDADEAAEPIQWRQISVNINGTDHLIDYQITGSGNTLNTVTGDVDAISLIAGLTTQSNGTLSLRFGQEIFDADAPGFIAFADGVDVDVEQDADQGTRNVIHIDFEAGTDEIEIVGDRIIPEFGSIAAILLAVAIVGIIVATARFSKLNFTQRL